MDTLVVLWTNDSKETAENMVFMYTLNAKLRGWWDNITFIIWGATTKLVANDKDVQINIKKMLDAGIKVRACKACAENLGVVEKLEEMNIDVVYIGKNFTEYLKNEKFKVITL